MTNGIYATGGRSAQDGTTNRVLVNKSVTLRSVNGPQLTVIQGYRPPSPWSLVAPIRCAYVSSNASLSGFTLTNGGSWSGGGGVWCESVSSVVSNCVLVGNYAADGSAGGGAYQGTLNNCTLTDNSVSTSDGELTRGGTADCLENNSIHFRNIGSRGCEDCGSPGSLAGNNPRIGAARRPDARAVRRDHGRPDAE